MLKFESLEVFQTEPASTIVVWVHGLTNDPLSGLLTDVYRSYAPEGPFVKVGSSTYPQRYFVDDHPGLHDRWRKAYYKIVSVFDGQTVEFGPSSSSDPVSNMPREMVRRKEIELRFNGIPVMVYLKRKGDRCKVCWDPYLKKATRSDCPSCFATGMEGGYYEPILTLANIVPEEKADQADVTRRQESQTSLSMSVVPVLRPQDIVYEVNNGIRWRVTRVTPVEMDRQLVGQEPVIVVKLNPTDIENKLPIPEKLEYLIQPHWHHYIKKKYDKVIHKPETSGGIVEEGIEIWR
jgi:hypothetical protein